MKSCCVLIFLLLFINTVVSQEPRLALNLENGDVLKCLVQTAEWDGWKLIKADYDSKSRLVLVFVKEGHIRRYISSQSKGTVSAGNS